MSPRAIDYIRQNFPLTPVPSVPEIRVHKAGPESGIWRLADIESEELPTPYWTTWWGGGIALARHVLDHPETVGGQRVLDLGAGSGLVGIAAAKAGAKSVLALDIDRYAVAVTRMNAEANGVALTAIAEDALSGNPPDVDVVLVGDLFYEADLAARTTAYLHRCIAKGMRVLVGDPRRAFLPQARLQFIAEYESGDFADGAARSAVYAFS